MARGADNELTLRMRSAGFDVATRDVRKLRREIREAGIGARKAGGRAGTGVFTRGIGMMAGAATAAVGALGVFGLAGAIRTAVGEFRESRRVTRDTSAAIRSMGAGTWTTAKGVEGLANSIAVRTGIDDEAIQAGENLLLTFGKIQNRVGRGNKIFDRATAAAVDMSRRGFGSLESTSGRNRPHPQGAEAHPARG
jgi:hypothetical protein